MLPHDRRRDYLIRIALPDITALEKFILEQLTPIPGIENPLEFCAQAGSLQDTLPLPRQLIFILLLP